jgi:lysophospholipase L1-like esterase
MKISYLSRSINLLLSLWVVTLLPLQAQPTASAKAPLRIMPMGDSITWGMGVPGGYRELLEKKLIDAGVPFQFVGTINNTDKGETSLRDKHCEAYSGFVINQGQPGGSGVGTGAGFGYGGLYDMLVSRKALDTPNSVDVVLLLIGTNDVSFNADNTQGTPLDRLKGLIRFIQEKQPDATVLVSTLPPIHSRPSPKTERLHAYNAALHDPAIGLATLSGITLVDLHAAFLKPDGTINADYYPPNDAIHPSKAGYDAIAEVWFSALQKSLQTQTTP